MTVEFYDCDPYLRQRPSQLVRRMQQQGENQLLGWGMGYEKMRSEHGMVFLLSRMMLNIRRLPASGESITLQTCPMGSKGSQLLRECVALGEEGELLCSLHTSWALYDINAGRIVRPSACPIQYESGTMSIAPDELRIKVEKGEMCREREVVYSDLDPNRHINNAAYLDIMCDLMPPQEMENCPPKQISIYYQQEAKWGETLSLYISKNENGHDIVGEVGDRPCFEGRIKF